MANTKFQNNATPKAKVIAQTKKMAKIFLGLSEFLFVS
jgi:hypothetical protein